MPTREETIRVLKILNLPDDQYAVCGGALLAEYGIRDNSRDIDLLVDVSLFNELRSIWHSTKHGSEKGIDTPSVVIDYWTIEAFPSIDFVDYETAALYISRAESREGIPFVQLKDMLEWKRTVVRDRPKHKKLGLHKSDAELIESYLTNPITKKDNEEIPF